MLGARLRGFSSIVIYLKADFTRDRWRHRMYRINSVKRAFFLSHFHKKYWGFFCLFFYLGDELKLTWICCHFSNRPLRVASYHAFRSIILTPQNARGGAQNQLRRWPLLKMKAIMCTYLHNGKLKHFPQTPRFPDSWKHTSLFGPRRQSI